MAQIDASIEDYSATELLADRVETYRLAVRLLREAGYDADSASPDDVLMLTQLLCNDIY
jgi:hypothetical protein